MRWDRSIVNLVRGGQSDEFLSRVYINCSTLRLGLYSVLYIIVWSCLSHEGTADHLEQNGFDQLTAQGI